MRTLALASALLAAVFFAGCGGESADDLKDKKSGIDIDTSQIIDGVGEELYGRARAMFYSMPTPLELQSMIESSGGFFRKDLLHDPQTASMYETKEQEAFALGV